MDVWIKANWLAFLCYIPIANLPGRRWSESPGSYKSAGSKFHTAGRGVVEPSWTQCLCTCSWDVKLSVQPQRYTMSNEMQLLTMQAINRGWRNIE